jgi:hypothetical protein
MTTPPRPVRMYCVPCGEICPHDEGPERVRWMEAHIRAKHQETGPMTKGIHFAPVPSSWG